MNTIRDEDDESLITYFFILVMVFFIVFGIVLICSWLIREFPCFFSGGCDISI